MPTSENIADPMSDNEALREILGEVRLLDGIIRQGYSSVAAVPAEEVSVDAPYVRAAGATIVKTVVTNTHATNDALVYEGGALVKRLPPGETWTSPLDGSGEITVSADSGNPSRVSIATYLA